ncbi:MAG: TatD family hydrolase [Deltaproteobacteria bacterium]|nr:TatD family hydrolase [Deltaproteobacteria bacterium]
MIDTHCHLYELPDPAAAVARARAAGVCAIVVPGIDAATSDDAVRLAAALPGFVLPAAGVHPDAACEAGEVVGAVADLARVETLARTGAARAVGECGLDRVGAGRDPRSQERAFLAQVALARDCNLPLLLHCRAAFDRMLRLLEPFGPHPAGGVLHAYNGSAEVADRFARLGLRFGVGGVATRPEAVRVRATVAAIPLDRLVLETDAPYIGTARVPKGAVSPADLPEVLAAAAGLKGMPEEVVDRVTDATARELLRL